MRHSVFVAAAAASLVLTSCSSAPTTAPVNSYVMGEKVRLGRLNYTVFETQWLTQLGQGPEARIPQNRFFLIRFSVTNGGTEDATIANPTIQDDAGKVYEELSNGEGVPQWAGYLRTVRPADTLTGNIVFDAPPGHYKLKLPDETGTLFAVIDLPLTYGSETPDIAPPVEKK
jgi:hypothetical protein